MDENWKVLVRLHNLVNIPRHVLVESGQNDVRIFSVVVHAVQNDGALLADCAEVCAEFTTRNILCTSVNDGDFLEVRLDNPNGRNTGVTTAAGEWSIRSPKLELLVVVKERWSSGVRILGTCSRNLLIDVADVVQKRKLVTHIVGTEMGQVGLSLAVAPSDSVGYRRRLVEFLSFHNPQGLHLVDSVVGSIPEIDTFTKLYRKYGLMDYEQRVNAFFQVYGREQSDRMSSLLHEWESREEELMRNLVLDNGPEPDTIRTATRFEAFLKAHCVTSATPDVARAMRELGDKPRELFAFLTKIYGPEPDPRTYLFPPTHYEPMQEKIALGPVPVLSSGHSTREFQCVAEANERHLLLDEKSQLPERPSAILSDLHTRVPSMEEKNGNDNINRKKTTKINTFIIEKNGNDSGKSNTRGDSIWEEFCELLVCGGRHPTDIFYMSKAMFLSAIENAGYTTTERDVLVHQWNQRLQAAVREEILSPADTYYDTATREVLDVVGLQPLNLDGSTMITVNNREHASCFAVRLAAAQQRATERLAIIGDYDKLRGIVLHGVSGDPAPQESPCAVFYRQPFRDWNRKQATCILVCDVITGKPFVCPPLVKTACEATEDFRREWDCCVFNDSVGRMALAVYDPKQVLPRYMLQCHVDTTVTPCPAHTSRAVEYYVIDENVFVCSRCVVLGSYRGKEVLTIEDAAAQARSRLSDYQRETQHLVTDLEACAVELNREAKELASGPKRLAAEREVDRIRREAEERVAAVLRALEEEEHKQLTELRLRQGYAAKAKEAAHILMEQINADLQHGSELQVMAALRRLQAGDELEHLKGELRRSGGVHNRRTNGSVREDSFVDHDKGVKSDGRNKNYNQCRGTTVLPCRVAESQSTSNDPVTKSLYAKYLALASGVERKEELGAPSIGSTDDKERSEVCTPSGVLSDRACHAKENITKGWELYNQGDREGARRVWNDVYKRHTNDAVGARVRAYIAEAVDGDYEAAARWYELSLQREPADTMTMYNYGVLLEALLGRRREALSLFERAHALGDSTAGRRAQQLRISFETS